MGGLALKNTHTRRYSAKEYDEIVRELLPKIGDAFNARVFVPVSITDKESHGDMDVLVENKSGFRNIKDTVQTNFDPNEIVANGNVYSFDYKELQVDLIFTPTKNWETSKTFFSFGDLGNLMGKIYHRFGLKYGYDGLKYHHYIGTYKAGTVYVSKDPKDIFGFLGLSYDRFLQGFRTIEDVFDYVIGCAYFSKDIFQWDNLNAINRKRNQRRPNYHYFLEYIDSIEEPNPNMGQVIRNANKTVIIDNYFVEIDFAAAVGALNDKAIRKQNIAAKFNGKLVMKRHPYLLGKELGNALSAFKNEIADHGYDFDEFVLKYDSKFILDKFDLFYKNVHKK